MDYFIKQGWQCPICKRVMAPNQNYCVFCSNQTSTITYGTVTGYRISKEINDEV